jgi:hypothetical protein
MYRNISQNIKGIIFLGTPHRGSELATTLDKVLSITFSAKTFVEQLQPNSEAIADINRLFRHRATDLDIISFYESLGMPGLGV